MIAKLFKVIVILGLVGMMTSSGYSQTRTRVYSYSDGKGKGWLGVNVQDVTPKLQEKKNFSAKSGAYVTEVVEDSPAEKADLQEGDVIVKFDGKEIEDGNDLIDAVRNKKPEAEVKVDIVRKAEKKTLAVTLGRVPNSMSFGFNNLQIPRMQSMPRMPRMPRVPSMPHGYTSPRFFMQSDKGGLEVVSLSRQLAEFMDVPEKNGILVSSVKKGSSAETAGFKAGDVIVKIEGKKVKNLEDLTEALDDNERDADLSCDVIRKGKSLTLKWHIEADDNSEDDDDYSFDSYAPDAHAQMKLEQMHRSLLHSPGLDHLKEHLNRLKNQLHEEMQQIKEKIHEHFSSLWEKLSDSFA
jgi:serine protease Do